MTPAGQIRPDRLRSPAWATEEPGRDEPVEERNLAPPAGRTEWRICPRTVLISLSFSRAARLCKLGIRDSQIGRPGHRAIGEPGPGSRRYRSARGLPGRR